MTDQKWQRRPDVAWIGDEQRVVAARTSPPDPDGPRVLEGAAAWVWLSLAEPACAEDLVAQALAQGAPESARDDVLSSLAALLRAKLAQLA